MRILFFGSAEFGIPCLNAIKSSDNELVGIFTQPAQPAGRKRKLKRTSVAVWAENNSVICIEAKNVNSAEMLGKIAEFGAELLVVIAFGQKIGTEVIDLHAKGAINVHSSLLPKYRGAAPINWAVINGETETGVSIITLAQKMDAGQVLGQNKVPINPDDTAETMHDKLAELAPGILLETISQIEAGKAVYLDQDESGVTHANKLKKSDGFIDWDQNGETIVNKIRGLWSWPGAQAIFVSAKSSKCSRVSIAKAEIAEVCGAEEKKTGFLNKGLNVVCADGAVKILQLKPSGGKLMEFKAFANGRSVKAGDYFMPIVEEA